MRRGRLLHVVTIEQLVAASPQQTATGAPDVAWSTYLTVMAGIEPLAGRELAAAQAIYPEVEVRIRMNYESGVTALMRVVDADSAVYSIGAVIDPLLRHRELELLCKTGVNQG